MTATPASATDPHLIAEHRKYFTFFNLSVALVAITVAEIVIIYLPIARWLILSSLAVMSVVKFAGVIWWFMHLRWDRLLLTVLFLSGLVVATGTVTALLFLFDPAPGGVVP